MAPPPISGRLARRPQRSERYKWIALINTTTGVLMVSIDGSIVLIAMPAIFRGIGLDPLLPSNSFYLLWMILGFLVVTSVLVVSLGRLGDMYGRVRIYNLGFAIFTFFSLLLTVTWLHGRGGAIFLIVGRIFQGVGGAMLFANSAAILTDAFPPNQRGMALGINGVAATSGTFIGLVVGGILAPIDWRLIFLVSVPIGLFCTAWAYLMLYDQTPPRRTSIDWAGNITFAAGLIAIMIGITYGIEPYRQHTMGWTNPVVDIALIGGVILLLVFSIIEKRTAEPMFRLPLFRIRAFTAGTLAGFLSAVGRGGLMFMLIIWLQGIWLPLHGYDFAAHPALGGHLHAAAHHRVPDRRADLRHAVRPVRGSSVRDRRHALHSPGLPSARAAAGELQLLGLRPPAAVDGPEQRPVHVAQPGRGDEQPAG